MNKFINGWVNYQIMALLRKCVDCGLEAWNKKDLENFTKDSRSKFGRKNLCGKCSSKRSMKWGKKNRDKINKYWRNNRDKANKYKKRYHDKLKKQVFDILGWKCECCKETIPEFLTVDHIENDGYKERINTHRAYYRKIIKLYKENPDEVYKRYRTLCFNCNLGRVINGGICPHKMDTI